MARSSAGGSSLNVESASASSTRRPAGLQHREHPRARVRPDARARGRSAARCSGCRPARWSRSSGRAIGLTIDAGQRRRVDRQRGFGHRNGGQARAHPGGRARGHARRAGGRASRPRRSAWPRVYLLPSVPRSRQRLGPERGIVLEGVGRDLYRTPMPACRCRPRRVRRTGVGPAAAGGRASCGSRSRSARSAPHRRWRRYRPSIRWAHRRQ